jgi:hypothetical protein
MSPSHHHSHRIAWILFQQRIEAADHKESSEQRESLRAQLAGLCDALSESSAALNACRGEAAAVSRCQESVRLR